MDDKNYMRLRCAGDFSFPVFREAPKPQRGGARKNSGGARQNSGGKREGAGRKPTPATIFKRQFVGPKTPSRCVCGVGFYRQGKGGKLLCDECSAKNKARKAGRCDHKKPLLKNGKERQICFECAPKKTSVSIKGASKHFCMACGVQYVANIKSSKYCSNNCRVDAGNATASVKVAAKSLEKNRKPRSCPGCKIEFCGIDSARLSKYCQPSCKSRHIEKNRFANNPLYALRARVRCLIYNSLKKRGYKKDSTTQEILGCTVLEFKRHIERQFLPGMSWDLRGAIHIDHIVPSSSAETEAEVIALSHFTNLRPMWAAENMRKSDSITHLI
jgi:hypothetical protein